MLRATLTLIVLAALWASAQAPALAQFRPSPSPRYFLIHCRGPLHLEASAPGGIRSLFVHFQPAPGPSGARGESLGSGQCAFVDRAVRSDEPLRIRWDALSFSTFADDRALHAAILQLVTTCARDPNCILRLSVRNAGTTGFNYFAPTHPVEAYSITTLR
jgi:hypothetical protein